MKIGVAQTKSVKGKIDLNIENHKRLIGLGVSAAVDIIIFPELSITGYEPALAGGLAMNAGDPGLDVFQSLSDVHQITIGVGTPTKNNKGTRISMIIFRPQQSRLVYSKKYIHADEEEFFTGGEGTVCLFGPSSNIAPAICYEISVPQHVEEASRLGADIYIASVTKTVKGVEKAIDTLAATARKHSMTVLMASCVGEADGAVCGGRSSIWDDQGLLLAQLDDHREGILVIDTGTREITAQIL